MFCSAVRRYLLPDIDIANLPGLMAGLFPFGWQLYCAHASGSLEGHTRKALVLTGPRAAERNGTLGLPLPLRDRHRAGIKPGPLAPYTICSSPVNDEFRETTGQPLKRPSGSPCVTPAAPRPCRIKETQDSDRLAAPVLKSDAQPSGRSTRRFSFQRRLGGV